MSKKVVAYLIALLIVVFIGATTFLLVKYLPERQELREKAATPEGVTTIALQPTSGAVAIGDTLVVDIVADITGYTVSMITAILELTYNSDVPPIVVVDQDPAADGTQVAGMIADLDYTLPNGNIVVVDEVAKLIRIQLSGYRLSGYTASQPVVFGRITLQGAAEGSIFASFDANYSKITDLAEGDDILLIPESTGSYTVSGGSAPLDIPTLTPTNTPTPTPTPTTDPGDGGSTPTNTPTPTPTPTTDPGGGGSTPTNTPTPTPTTSSSFSGTTSADPTATPIPVASSEELPVTGISLPTMGIVAAGLIFFFSALFLL